MYYATIRKNEIEEKCKNILIKEIFTKQLITFSICVNSNKLKYLLLHQFHTL